MVGKAAMQMPSDEQEFAFGIDMWQPAPMLAHRILVAPEAQKSPENLVAQAVQLAASAVMPRFLREMMPANLGRVEKTLDSAGVAARATMRAKVYVRGLLR